MKTLSSILLSAAIIIAGYFISTTIYNAKVLDRTVTVKGLSERIVDANLAVWPLQITLADNNLSHLNNTIKSQRNNLIEFLEKIGFTKDEITSGNVNIKDLKSDPYLGNKKFIHRYTSEANIVIRTTDINKIHKNIDGIVGFSKNDVIIRSKNTWQPVNYFFTGLNKIKPEMVKEATFNAKKVAQEFAKDSGSSIGKIKNAKQGVFSISNRDNATRHIKKVRVVTTVTYFLED